MKYPKFLQVLTLAAIVTSALPVTETAVYASERETPKEYEARTDYDLPNGYHYVLSDGKYVSIGDNGKALIEKNEEKKAEVKKPEEKKPEVKKTEEKKAEVKKTEEKKPEEKKTEEKETEEKKAEEKKAKETPKAEAPDTEEKKSEDVTKDSEQEKSESSESNGTGTGTESGAEGGSETNNSGSGDGTGSGSGNEDSSESGSDEDGSGSGSDEGGSGNEDGSGSGSDENGSGNEDGSGNGDGTGSGSENGDGSGSDSGNEDGSESGSDEGGSGNEDGSGNGDGTGSGSGNEGGSGNGSETDGSGSGSGNENGAGSGSEADGSGTGTGSETGSKEDLFVPAEPEKKDTEKKYTLKLPETSDMEITPNPYFKASKPFTAIGDRICYNVEVPIEGIPSFITQEMVVGALKAQDETGFPASVTIAQIINESGYGKYGPGGESGQGLSYLAYQYCNLFGIKGTGTAGSAVMQTREMTSGGSTYSIRAGFRAYNTYTECIEDRSKLLKNVYSDLTRNVTDANTFAMRIGGRWATSINYGQGLIKTMETYDLYRLDEMTLMDFNQMIGTFANPCPGSHVTSTFGYRDFDNKFHKGLDLGTGSRNIPTYAVEAGTVTFAGSAGAAGNLIIIDHGDGLVTKYMHHSRMYVKMGQEVEKGQQIGLSGTTGRSTGNHLHFQVEKDGVAMNPAIYLMEDGLQARACD